MKIKTKDGRTLYPVCSWEQNQHKLFYAYYHVLNEIYDAEEAGKNTDKLYARFTEIEHLLNAFNDGVRNDGLVYATWKDGQRMKEYIFGYDVRH